MAPYGTNGTAAAMVRSARVGFGAVEALAGRKCAVCVGTAVVEVGAALGGLR